MHNVCDSAIRSLVALDSRRDKGLVPEIALCIKHHRTNLGRDACKALAPWTSSEPDKAARDARDVLPRRCHRQRAPAVRVTVPAALEPVARSDLSAEAPGVAGHDSHSPHALPRIMAHIDYRHVLFHKDVRHLPQACTCRKAAPARPEKGVALERGTMLRRHMLLAEHRHAILIASTQQSGEACHLAIKHAVARSNGSDLP